MAIFASIVLAIALTVVTGACGAMTSQTVIGENNVVDDRGSVKATGSAGPAINNLLSKSFVACTTAICRS